METIVVILLIYNIGKALGKYFREEETRSRICHFCKGKGYVPNPFGAPGSNITCNSCGGSGRLT